jgi:hypothetical protein
LFKQNRLINFKSVKPQYMKRKHYYLLALLGLSSTGAMAQLNIQSGAQFFISSGATVTVQGDVTSNDNILGTGTLQMKGTALQNINMNGFTIPNLEIDNTTNVALTGAGKVSGVLTFTNGKLQLGANNFSLTSTASVTGAGAGKFAQADGTGEFRKEITATGNYTLPVGEGNNYNPVTAQLTAGTVNAGAYVGARCLTGAHPSKPVRSTDYLLHRWPITYANVTSPTLAAVGTYVDPTNVNGAEASLRGITYNGAQWNLAGTNNDAALNTVTATIAASGDQLYGMNRFLLLKAKTLLMGANPDVSGIMSESLRGNNNNNGAGGAGAVASVIPLSDPYRTAPYSSFYTHTVNTDVEIATSAVFNTQAITNDNIIDWVFVELRNTTVSPGNAVITTRSALLQRDGDIVDVDGVSPLYFKDLSSGNYTVAVRHRNHIGMSTDPATNLRALSEANPVTTLDFTSAGNDVYVNGAIVSNTPYNIVNGFRVLWGGNANMNTNVNYSALGNDRLYLLNTILGGSATGSVAGYSVGDLNMNRTANYSALGNDRLFLLNTVLGGSATSSKSQHLPN